MVHITFIGSIVVIRCVTLLLGFILVPKDQARSPEEGDQHGRTGDDDDQVPLATIILRNSWLAQRGVNRVQHEQQPQEQADQQEVLVEAAQLHVLVALVAEVLAHEEALETLCDGGHLPCHGSPNDDQQAKKEKVAQRLL